MRKVIIIDNDRIGTFDLCSMNVERASSADEKLRYELSIRSDEVIRSKRLVNKILMQIRRRIKFEGR